MTTIERLTDYLCNGGLFNPEMMDHEKVRNMLLDVRAELESLQAELKTATRYGQEKDETATVFMNQVKKLQAENAALRKDIESLGWCHGCGEPLSKHCPKCEHLLQT